eukprot:Rmarinus@m.12063
MTADNTDPVLKELRSQISKLSPEQRELSYAEVASAVGISEEEVEQWVIKAISKKLLEARLDQMRKVVRVTKRVLLEEEEPDWEKLRDRMGEWQENLQGVLQVVEAAKQQRESVDALTQ